MLPNVSRSASASPGPSAASRDGRTSTNGQPSRDATARYAIWQRYIPDSVTTLVDLDALVEASNLFTPADIEFAARKASQRAMESAVYAQADAGGQARGPRTDDYLVAIGETRSTLTDAMVAEFNEDIERIARL